MREFEVKPMARYTDDPQHWSARLPEFLMEGGKPPRPIVIELDPLQAAPAAVMIARRIGGIVEALSLTPDEHGVDPLLREELDDLLALLDHIHQARMVLEAEEERVLVVAHERGATLGTLAGVLELKNASGVFYRLKRIRQAHDRNLSVAALDDAEAELVADEQAGDPERCPHQNLGPVQVLTGRDGKTSLQATCLDCGTELG